MSGKATLKDIATKTGYSMATVSMALSGKKTRIPEATREKIQAIAEELNYKPNLVAKSLATNRTNTIGMIIPNFEDQSFTTFTSGMEEGARTQGYSLLICNSGNSIETCIAQVKLLEARGVDAMAIIPPAQLNESPLLSVFSTTMEKLSIPFVLVDRAVHDLFHDYVATDNIQGGYLAGIHLLSLGHTRIGVIAGPQKEYGTIKRLLGLRSAFTNFSMKMDEELVEHSDYTVEGGYKAAKMLLEKDISAIFALNDMMAIGAYRAIVEKGLRIPEDISVIGFDNNPSSSLIAPPLTTISQPFQTIGLRASEILLERLESPDRANRDYFFAPSLVVRQSTRAKFQN